MNNNPQVQQQLRKRVNESREQRMQVAKRYLSGDWLNVADTRQTYDRLVRKGHREQAEQLLHLAERGLERTFFAGPQLLEAEIIPAAEDLESAQDQLAEIGETVYEAILGTSEIMPVSFLHEGSHVAHSVGRIITFPGRIANGTGFLVSSRLLLTNNHVLPNKDAARGNIVQFEYFAHDDGGPISPVEFKFQPDVFFLTSPVSQVDFSLVGVERVNGNNAPLAQFGWNNLIADLGKAQQGERLNIIHHPGGLPQQVSIRQNFLALLLPVFVHYVTDTRPGSSGSPVFNEEWEVVALHHAAREITDPEEVRLYLQVLRGIDLGEGLGVSEHQVTINEGARVSQIVKRLKEMHGDLNQDQRRLLDEVLSGAPPPPSATFSRRLLAPAESSFQVDTGGTTTWTIPLRVSVNLGVGGVTAGTPAAPAEVTVTPGREPDLRDLSARLELFTNEIDTQKSVFRALSFLQEARERDYLPPDDEIEARKTEYYGDLIDKVNNGEVQPDKLYEALHDLLRGTLNLVDAFPESLSSLESLNTAALESGLQLESVQYDRARAHLYTWVDLQENRMLRGIYTNTIIAPEQLMLKDLMVKLGHEDLLPQRFRSNQFLNCEHIVPQSWFDKAPIGVSDLHHLITADGAANNFRSDCAYRVLNGDGDEGPQDRPPYIPAAGVKNRPYNLFEPSNGKPVVARATLYFLITHKKIIDGSKYGPKEIDMLKGWAKSAAPSRYELHRNEAIFESQGNRNPLIDFPEWIDLIDFTLGVE